MLSFRAARRYASAVSRVKKYSTPSETPQDPAAYCRELVRKHDYESFLISKFWPGQLQDGYFAIKAFSVRLLAKGPLETRSCAQTLFYT
ncbi:hypothetical protein K438DRAFT_1883037 [Mycena galopus ATCC 62051]|nr:hypothetical protein K438DRAFT_1883037 [Mycena galopus ATCC 62051]